MKIPHPSIVEKSETHLKTRSNIVTEPITAARLLLEKNMIEFVIGDKGGDGACIFRLFAEGENIITANQQDVDTNSESLTVTVEITLV